MIHATQERLLRGDWPSQGGQGKFLCINDNWAEDENTMTKKGIKELSKQWEQHRQSLCKKEHVKNKTCVFRAERHRQCIMLADARKESDGWSTQGLEFYLFTHWSPHRTTGHHFSWLSAGLSQREMKKKPYFTLSLNSPFTTSPRLL